jgi:hypothetical protein
MKLWIVVRRTKGSFTLDRSKVLLVRTTGGPPDLAPSEVTKLFPGFDLLAGDFLEFLGPFSDSEIKVME